jgi:hypothetical protein
MTGMSLEREQEELLRALVEASRKVPRDQREEFLMVTDVSGTAVIPDSLAENCASTMATSTSFRPKGCSWRRATGAGTGPSSSPPRASASTRRCSVVRQLQSSRSRRS